MLSIIYFCSMETLVLRTKDKKESRLLMDLLSKMHVDVQRLSKNEQEDFLFGKILKKAVKEGEAKPTSIQKIINKWKYNLQNLLRAI